jgi:hypothetical protein
MSLQTRRLFTIEVKLGMSGRLGNVNENEGLTPAGEDILYSRAKTMKRSTLFVRASAFFWICFVVLNQYFYRTRPRSPDLQRTYPWPDHGHSVYLNATENYGLFLLVAAGVGCVLGAFFTKAQSKARME